MHWQELFVEREAEIRNLENCWTKAVNRQPQLAVLLAPPGMGKTRLVQEFFAHLSTSYEAVGDSGYWPDRLGRDRDRLALNCLPGQCNPQNPMTMLWWAIKCVDTGSNAAASSDLHQAHSLHLQPHLDVRRTGQQLEALRKRRNSALRGAAGEVGASIAEKGAELIPVVGPFVGLIKSAARGIASSAKAYREFEEESGRLEQRRLDIGGHAIRAGEDFESLLMLGLQEFAVPADASIAPVPIIIVVDDAQFADQDAALASFLRRFMQTAWSERWPVLVIFTHWPKEWRERAGDPDTLPGLIEAARRNDASSFSIIEIGRLRRPETIVQTAIPGLPDAQMQALVRKAGGNPRYLERLLQLLLESPALFEARACHGALHPDALEEILDEKFDLHEVTRRLLESSPIDARRAAALASVQGERFLDGLVTELAARLGQEAPAEGLGYCHTPLSIFTEAEAGIREFAQGVFREVARTLVPRVVDRESLVVSALTELLTHAIDDWDDRQMASAADSWISDLLLLDLAIGLGDASPDGSCQRTLMLRATSRKGELLLSRGDLAGARAIFDAWPQLVARYPASTEKIDAIDTVQYVQWLQSQGRMSEARERAMAIDSRIASEATLREKRASAFAHGMLGDVLQATDGPAAALPHYEAVMRLMQEVADALGTPGARQDLALAHSRLGDVLQAIDGPAAALPHYEAYMRLMQEVADALGTPGARQDLAVAHSRLGDVLQATDGPAAALPHYEAVMRLMQEVADALGTPGAKRELGVAHGRLGDVLQAIDGPAAALPHYGVSMTLLEQIDIDAIDIWNWRCAMHTSLADAKEALEGPDAASSDRKTACDIAARLNNQLGTVDSALGLLCASRDLLKGQLLGPAPWARAFARENLHPEVVGPLLVDLERLADDWREWAGRAGKPIATGWYGAILIQLATAQFAGARHDDATASLALALPDLRELAAAEPGQGRSLLANALLLSARLSVSSSGFAEAEVAFGEALQLMDNETEPREALSLRLEAATCWYYSRFLQAGDRGEEARQLLARGLTAAQRFARFGRDDGAAILGLVEEEMRKA